VDRIELVCDVTRTGSISVVRYSSAKTLEFLRGKVDKVVQSLPEQSISLVQGSATSAYMLSSVPKASEADKTLYAVGTRLV
jgi:hypothetical protein